MCESVGGCDRERERESQRQTDREFVGWSVV